MKENTQNGIVRWTESSRNTSDIEQIRKNSRLMLEYEIETEGTKQTIYKRLTEKIPILNRYMDSNIFSKILHKKQSQIINFLNDYDIDTSDINWLDINRIIFKDDMSCKGLWNPVRESIELCGTRKKIDKKIEYTLVHELLHSISRNSNHESMKNVGEINTLSGRSGIATTINQYKYNKNTEHVGSEEIRNLNLFNALNEAVTELITMYIEQVHHGSYAREVQLLTQIIKSIAIGRLPAIKYDKKMENQFQKTKMKIFNMFIKSYMYGWDKELKKEILENFGESALTLLAGLDTNELQDNTIHKNFEKFFNCNKHTLKEEEQKSLALDTRASILDMRIRNINK